METRDKIIEGACNLFFEYGIKSITMDDIAKSLAMSKKTLYHYFSTKEALISALLIQIQYDYKKQLEQLTEESQNITEELAKLTCFLKNKIAFINPVLIYDLKKHYPSSYEIFKEFKWSFITKHVSHIIERGIKEGLFRNNINPEIIARMRVEQIETAFNQEIFPKDQFNFNDVHMQLYEHFIIGLCTKEGIKKINALQDQYNNCL